MKEKEIVAQREHKFCDFIRFGILLDSRSVRYYFYKASTLKEFQLFM